MLFRVRREFTWDGKTYRPGEVIDIPEGHPRLTGLIQGRWIIYDASSTPATPKVEVNT